MNHIQLARSISKRSQVLVSSRLFYKGASAIPTSAAVEVGGYKVLGLPHLSVRRHLRFVFITKSMQRVHLLTFFPLTLIFMTSILDISIFLQFQTPSMSWAYRKKHWFSDPSTYPLIGVLGFASAFCTAFGFYTLGTNPDVQISPLKRYVSAGTSEFLYLFSGRISWPTETKLFKR